MVPSQLQYKKWWKEPRSKWKQKYLCKILNDFIIFLGSLYKTKYLYKKSGAAIWLPGAFAPGFLGSKFSFSKLFKKFRKKPCTYLTMARTTLWNFAAKCHRMRPVQKWQISRSEIQIFGSHFMSEICHFCSGRIRWHFATTFYTVVRAMIRYVHDFFSNFFDKFSIYSDFSKKPGAYAPGSHI